VDTKREDIPEHIIDTYAEQFQRQGFTIVRGALGPEQAGTLLASVNQAFDETEDGYGPNLRARMFERGAVFLDLIEQPVIIDLVEKLLGNRIHLVSMNSLRTPRDSGIDKWHVDDDLFFPLPDGVELDPRIALPIYMLTCIYYLVDVEENMGPTQLIPGSHRSGRHPERGPNPPLYKDQGPVSITVKKGDCLVFFGQTWHRGARNESDNKRIVQQVVYGKRWVSQRFYPFVNYQLPQNVMDWIKDDPRRAALLGLHPSGAYG
jgi:ectoine hydroxylase-related dioxygenase (phytanoyl-CoA dioxygenase family)